MVTYNSFHNKEAVMKKLVLVFMASVLLASQAYCAQVTKEIIDRTLSKTSSTGEADINIADSKRVSFFVNIDNSATTAAVTATVTAATSLNGTDWTDISWLDVAGGVTPQTTETTTAKKQQYVGWLDNRLIGRYLRIRVNATNMTSYPSAYASETADLSVTVVQDK
jgi:hypothetical protein